MVMRLVQVGGAITLLLLGGSFWLTISRDLRRRGRGASAAGDSADAARKNNQ
jgi:hypothetical protein